MASTMTIRGCHRPMSDVVRVNGVPCELAPAEAVVVTADRYSDGVFVTPVVVKFADYAGLEAEWEAGTAVAVMVAAVADEIAAVEVPHGTLTVAQRGAAGDELPMEA